MAKNDKQAVILKALVWLLELLALAVVVYLIVLPIYPGIKYSLQQSEVEAESFKDLAIVEQETVEILEAVVQKAKQPISKNRIVITKIGVNSPIIESDNEAYALNHGAWILPQGSTPDQGGNTVITGHRFKYLPPNNLTFYLFDKLTLDDIVSVNWQGKTYYYQIHRIFIADKYQVSILEPSDTPKLTMFTCDPVFSEENRLVIIADLIED